MSGEDSDSSSSGNSRNEWIDEFEDFCSSEDLSLDELQRMTKDISLDNLRNSSFLHRVCMNEKVTLEIVEYLLHLCPQTIHRCLDIDYEHVISAFPLHLACYNEYCPNEVIDLLLRKNPYSSHCIAHIGYIEFNWANTDMMDCYHGGTPLHFYLSRSYYQVDLDIVKRLVASTETLLLTDENEDEGSKCTPIHILMHNKSIGKMTDVLRYLAETNPSSLLAQDKYERTTLHVACEKSYIDARTIQVLLGTCVDSVYRRNFCNALPIHSLCEVKEIDDEVALEILQLFLEAKPDLVTQTQIYDGEEELPLHLAAGNKSQAFCKVLVDAYPESVKRRSSNGSLPFHDACYSGRPDTVEYLFRLYPESLHIRTDGGSLPIHMAVSFPNMNASKNIEFLLTHDPECVSNPISSDDCTLPLHMACNCWDRSNVTELLYDLYPEAILIRNEQGRLPIEIARRSTRPFINPDTGRMFNEEYEERNQEMINFLSTQMDYATKAQDRNAMETPEPNGLLPLQNAIRDGAPLGTIKLLVKGDPDAVNISDVINDMLPLDIASQSSTVGVVKYLAELSPDRLNTCDMNNNYLLHHACRGGNCEVISYLLETPMSSVSERNFDGMLPIHLFCKFVNEQEESEDTTEYTETIWRLLTAYPETVMNW